MIGLLPLIAACAGLLWAGAKTPMTHVVALKAETPALNAGTAFLADRKAQEWVLAHRPHEAAGLLETAYRLDDISQVLTQAADASALRTALLQRTDEPMVFQPERLMSIVEKTPELMGRADLYAQALLEWKTLPEDARAALPEQDRNHWGAWSVMYRRQRLEETYLKQLDAVDAGFGSAAFIGRRKEALEKAHWLLSHAERIERRGELAAAEEIAAITTRVKDALVDSDPMRGPILPDLDAAKDYESAAAILRPAYFHAGLRELKPAPPPLEPSERAAFVSALGSALADHLAGDAFGRWFADFARSRGIKTDIGNPVGAAIAYADWRGGRVVYGAQALGALVQSLGRHPRQILSDPASMSKLAEALADVHVHELIHHYQRVRDPIVESGNIDYEVEAHAAQAVYLRRQTQSSWVPAYTLPSDEGTMRRMLHNSAYSVFVTLSRLNARMIRDAVRQDQSAREVTRDWDMTGNPVRSRAWEIDAELAWRRRQPKDVQAALQRQEARNSRSMRELPTRFLRRLRRGLPMAVSAAALNATANVSASIARAYAVLNASPQTPKEQR